MNAGLFPGWKGDNEYGYLRRGLSTNPLAYRLEDVDLVSIERVPTQHIFHRLLLQCHKILKYF